MRVEISNLRERTVDDHGNEYGSEPGDGHQKSVDAYIYRQIDLGSWNVRNEKLML